MTRRPISPVWLVLAGIASVQFGAALAKALFDTIEPTAMVWLRLVTSAIVLVAIARPTLRGRSRDDWLTMLAFGLSLGTMNWAIYQSFSRIPLGLAVTIEFAGPLVLAVVMSRRARDLLWVGLAALGVGLLGFERTDLDPVGIAFALLAGACWAAYILLSVRTGRRWAGLDGLAMASVVASVLLAPLAIPAGGSDLLDPKILLLGAAVGLMSSVIPYAADLTALRTMKPSVFSILMSLEPAAAALAGMLLLQEFLSPLQWTAVVAVTVASVGRVRRSGRRPRRAGRRTERAPRFAAHAIGETDRAGGASRRHNSSHGDLTRVHRGHPPARGVGGRVPPHPQRRRHPVAGVDQRPARPDRRPHGRALQRPGREPVVLARPAARRLRGARDLVEPPRDRRFGSAEGP